MASTGLDAGDQIANLESAVARLAGDSTRIGTAIDRVNGQDKKLDALAGLVKLMGSHLEKVADENDRRTAAIEQIVARVDGQHKALIATHARLETDFKTLSNNYQRLENELKLAHSKSSGGDSKESEVLRQSLLLAIDSKIDAVVSSHVRRLTERLSVDASGTESRLTHVITERLASYNPAQLWTACDQRITERVHAATAGQSALTTAATSAVENALRALQTIDSRVASVETKSESRYRQLSDQITKAAEANKSNASSGAASAAESEQQISLISDLNDRLAAQSRTALATTESIERKINSLTLEFHTVKGTVAESVDQRLNGLAVDLASTLQSRMNSVQESIEKKFQTGVFDVKQTLISVNDSVDKRLLEHKTENAVKFTALAANFQVPEERFTAMQKRVDACEQSVASTRDVIGACSRGLIDLKQKTERGFTLVAEDTTQFRRQLEDGISALKPAISQLKRKINEEVLGSINESKTKLEATLKSYADANTELATEVRGRAWTAEQTCTRLADDMLHRMDAQKKKVDDSQRTVHDAVRSELAENVRSVSAYQKAMRDEFKKREKKLTETVHSIEERVHSLARAIKANLPIAATAVTAAAASNGVVPPSPPPAASAASATAAALDDGEWQSRAQALRREWMTCCQSLDERLAVVERDCVRTPDLDNRLSALSSDIASDVHQRWTLIARTVDEKLTLLERTSELIDKKALFQRELKGAASDSPVIAPAAAAAAAAAPDDPTLRSRLSRLDVLSSDCDRMRQTLDAAITAIRGPASAAPDATTATAANGSSAASPPPVANESYSGIDVDQLDISAVSNASSTAAAPAASAGAESGSASARAKPSSKPKPKPIAVDYDPQRMGAMSAAKPASASAVALCSKCGANWSIGQFSDAKRCSECSGSPLTRKCCVCNGACGRVWNRSVLESQSSHVAVFTGSYATHRTAPEPPLTHVRFSVAGRRVGLMSAASPPATAAPPAAAAAAPLAGRFVAVSRFPASEALTRHIRGRMRMSEFVFSELLTQTIADPPLDPSAPPSANALTHRMEFYCVRSPVATEPFPRPLSTETAERYGNALGLPLAENGACDDSPAKRLTHASAAAAAQAITIPSPLAASTAPPSSTPPPLFPRFPEALSERDFKVPDLEADSTSTEDSDTPSTAPAAAFTAPAPDYKAARFASAPAQASAAALDSDSDDAIPLALRTRTPNGASNASPRRASELSAKEAAAFAVWRADAITFLTSQLDEENERLKELRRQRRTGRGKRTTAATATAAASAASTAAGNSSSDDNSQPNGHAAGNGTSNGEAPELQRRASLVVGGGAKTSRVGASYQAECPAVLTAAERRADRAQYMARLQPKPLVALSVPPFAWSRPPYLDLTRVDPTKYKPAIAKSLYLTQVATARAVNEIAEKEHVTRASAAAAVRSARAANPSPSPPPPPAPGSTTLPRANGLAVQPAYPAVLPLRTSAAVAAAMHVDPSDIYGYAHPQLTASHDAFLATLSSSGFVFTTECSINSAAILSTANASAAASTVESIASYSVIPDPYAYADMTAARRPIATAVTASPVKPKSAAATAAAAAAAATAATAAAAVAAAAIAAAAAVVSPPRPPPPPHIGRLTEFQILMNSRQAGTKLRALVSDSSGDDIDSGADAAATATTAPPTRGKRRRRGGGARLGPPRRKRKGTTATVVPETKQTEDDVSSAARRRSQRLSQPSGDDASSDDDDDDAAGDGDGGEDSDDEEEGDAGDSSSEEDAAAAAAAMASATTVDAMGSKQSRYTGNDIVGTRNVPAPVGVPTARAATNADWALARDDLRDATDVIHVDWYVPFVLHRPIPVGAATSTAAASTSTAALPTRAKIVLDAFTYAILTVPTDAPYPRPVDDMSAPLPPKHDTDADPPHVSIEIYVRRDRIESTISTVAANANPNGNRKKDPHALSGSDRMTLLSGTRYFAFDDAHSRRAAYFQENEVRMFQPNLMVYTDPVGAAEAGAGAGAVRWMVGRSEPALNANAISPILHDFMWPRELSFIIAEYADASLSQFFEPGKEFSLSAGHSAHLRFATEPAVHLTLALLNLGSAGRTCHVAIRSGELTRVMQPDQSDTMRLWPGFSSSYPSPPRVTNPFSFLVTSPTRCRYDRAPDDRRFSSVSIRLRFDLEIGHCHLNEPVHFTPGQTHVCLLTARDPPLQRRAGRGPFDPLNLSDLPPSALSYSTLKDTNGGGDKIVARVPDIPPGTARIELQQESYYSNFQARYIPASGEVKAYCAPVDASQIHAPSDLIVLPFENGRWAFHLLSPSGYAMNAVMSISRIVEVAPLLARYPHSVTDKPEITYRHQTIIHLRLDPSVTVSPPDEPWMIVQLPPVASASAADPVAPPRKFYL